MALLLFREEQKMGNNETAPVPVVTRTEDYNSGEHSLKLEYHQDEVHKRGNFIFKQTKGKHRSGALACDYSQYDKTYTGSFFFRADHIYFIIKKFHLFSIHW